MPTSDLSKSQTEMNCHFWCPSLTSPKSSQNTICLFWCPPLTSPKPARQKISIFGDYLWPLLRQPKIKLPFFVPTSDLPQRPERKKLWLRLAVLVPTSDLYKSLSETNCHFWCPPLTSTKAIFGAHLSQGQKEIAVETVRFGAHLWPLQKPDRNKLWLRVAVINLQDAIYG